jgi:putative membrane protein
MLSAMTRGLLAFLARLALSAAAVWGAVAFVDPGNPANTFGRAIVVSVVLSVAYYITLAKFLWFLLLPWLIYVVFWLGTIMGTYDLRFFQALLVAVGLAVISWLVGTAFGVKTFRKT